MKVGEYIYANTNAEFLNELLGTSYKAWMKSSMTLPDGKLIWMIELGDFVTKSGWINRLVSSNQLREKHITKDFSYYSHDTYRGALEAGKPWGPETRVVFEKVSFKSSKKYIFRGVFRINKEKSTVEENIWDLIMDENAI